MSFRVAGYSAVKPTLAKLAKFRQIRHRQCCGKTLSKLPNLPLRAFLDISASFAVISLPEWNEAQSLTVKKMLKCVPKDGKRLVNL